MIVGSGLAAVALAAAGCGGQTQAAKAPRGTYTVAVTRASFPKRQRLAQESHLVVTVRNTGRKTVPDVAVTIETKGYGTTAQAFSYYDPEPDLADHSRPIWVLDDGPTGGDTVYSNTWSLGSLAPGESASFNWRVTAVKAGRYTIQYTVAADLVGNAKARLRDGRLPHGELPVRISARPGQSRVSPSGRLIRGQ